MTASLFPSPGAGFDQPFEMLYACHERVQRSLDLLSRLVAHVRQHGTDDQAARAAQDVMRYFDIAAPLHHEDEERHVFPRLEQGPQLREAIARLRAEHDEFHRLWGLLRAQLQAVATGGTGLDIDALAQAAQAFVDIHIDHVATENDQVFPAARAQVQREGDTARAAIGNEMAHRRGVGTR